jgi:AraC-like DNA-binding protein
MQKRIRNMCLHHIWLMYFEESVAEQRLLERSERKHPDPLIAQAATLIEKNSFRKVDLKEMSETLGISQVRLTQRFKADFGVSPTQSLTAIRLEKAKTLLLETVDQIFDCVGYQNGYYLNRLIAKHFHLPPAAFRKAHRV